MRRETLIHLKDAAAGWHENLSGFDEQGMQMRVLVAVAVGAALIAGTAINVTQARAGDAANGAGLTQRWCSGCHVIGSASHGQDAAPSLPPQSRDKAWLHAWLTNPHPPMPDLHLSRQEIDDITTYLESLPQK